MKKNEAKYHTPFSPTIMEMEVPEKFINLINNNYLSLFDLQKLISPFYSNIMVILITRNNIIVR